MSPPTRSLLQPYASLHREARGPGDDRPTALQIVQDLNAFGTCVGKNILITGCSSGLGVETARALYETGAKLYLTARDMPKLQGVIDDIVSQGSSRGDSSHVQPEAIEMHLDSIASIRHASLELLDKIEGSLNALILNGGTMAGPLEYTTDGFERQIGVNHFSGFLLFQLLKSALLKAARSTSTASRVIILSSAGHAWSPVHFRDLNWKRFPMTYNQWQAYGSSKTANIYTASVIDQKFQPHIRAWSVHPSGIATELARNLRENDFAGFGDIGEIFATYKSAEQGAASAIWAALDPKAETIGGECVADCGQTSPRTDEEGVNGSGYAEHAYDRKAAEELWQLSEKLLDRK